MCVVFCSNRKEGGFFSEGQKINKAILGRNIVGAMGGM